MDENQWHYKDERSGKRLGPVSRDQVGEMIASDRIERSTMVWHPTMAQWAAASTTDLAALFGDGPPPLPASEISRWSVYALALLPLVGLFLQAAAAAVISARSGQSVQDVFNQRIWIFAFIVGNCILGEIEARNLRKGGLRLRGAAFMAGFLAPVYIFGSCRAFRRHAGPGIWSAYLPMALWIAAVIAALATTPVLFDPDAPMIFRPDLWF